MWCRHSLFKSYTALTLLFLPSYFLPGVHCTTSMTPETSVAPKEIASFTVYTVAPPGPMLCNIADALPAMTFPIEDRTAAAMNLET